MNGSFEVISSSVEQTHMIAAGVAGCVCSGDVIALIGELGAGKTQFVQGLASGMNIDEREVNSPTFVLMQEYESTGINQPVLIHIDAYRMSGLNDLASIGWDEDGEQFRHGAVVAVEWADRISDWLPADRMEVCIDHADEGRVIVFTGYGDWTQRMDSLRTCVNQVDSGSEMRWAASPSYVGRCPVCTKSVEEMDAYFPFCSKRCRQIDLGKWLDEKYMISRPVEESDLDEGE